MYFIEVYGTVVKITYESIEGVVKASSSLAKHKWIKRGIKGNYLFSAELDTLELEKLIEISTLRKHNNLKVWAYDALTL
jgi:hypothetical protein